VKQGAGLNLKTLEAAPCLRSKAHGFDVSLSAGAAEPRRETDTESICFHTGAVNHAAITQSHAHMIDATVLLAGKEKQISIVQVH